jgi:hypothetical protein
MSIKFIIMLIELIVSLFTLPPPTNEEIIVPPCYEDTCTVVSVGPPPVPSTTIPEITIPPLEEPCGYGCPVDIRPNPADYNTIFDPEEFRPVRQA